MKKLLPGFIGLLVALNAAALDPNHFSITRITAPYFMVDGSNPTAITGCYVGFEVTNNANSGSTYCGLKFTITSIGTSVPGQNYSLVSPASGVINVGTLAPGQSKVCYYYINYPSSIAPEATFNVQLNDNTTNGKTGSFIISNRSSFSSTGGGSNSQIITNQDIVGGLLYNDVTYPVEALQSGDETDFQVSVVSQYEPTKVHLVSTSILSSSVPGIDAGTTDSLYFISGNASNGATVTIRWIFKITASNFITTFLPSVGSSNGSNNYKYSVKSSSRGGISVTVSASDPLTIARTSNKTLYATNELATFTVNISNTSAYGVYIDRFTDAVPAGFTYQSIEEASSVTTGNSTRSPAAGSTGTIVFEGSVVSGNIESYYIPAGAGITLIYKATAPGYNAYNLPGTVRAYVGLTEVGSSTSYVNVSNTLPVTLISFTGEWLDDRAQLNWTTVSEFNSLKMEIERSYGSGEFIKIGERSASGFSSVNRNYSFIDYTPSQDKNRYRLKLIDIDGKFTYSSILQLGKKVSDFSISAVFPNPFTSGLNISLNADRKQRITIEVVNSAGVVLTSLNRDCTRGQNIYMLNDLSALPRGNYFLRIRGDGNSVSALLVK